MSTSTWKLGDTWERIVAVGDIHGDLDALLRILLGTQLVNDAGDWQAPSTLLVLMGDLNDRGPDSANVVSLIMRLQERAAAAGGKVESLMGNHEMLAAQGDYRYTRGREVLALETFWFDDLNGLQAIYRGNSPYARWLRVRPTIVAAGRCLFVHAGLDEWARQYDPEWINQGVSSWVAHFQGVAPEPAQSTLWLTNDDAYGPLWTNRFLVDPAEPNRDRAVARCVAEAISGLGAERLVVGHRPTERIDYQIAYPHPVFGDAVAVIDTGISRFYGGQLSALELADERIGVKYFERGSSELSLTSQIRRRCEHERQALSDANAAEG